MRIPRRPFVLVAATLSLGFGFASADEAPTKDGKPAKAAEKSPAKEQIAWRPQWTEAAEEAAERNVLVMIHSHGST